MHTTNINVLNYSCNHGTELDVTVWCESFYFCSFNCFSREAALAWSRFSGVAVLPLTQRLPALFAFPQTVTLQGTIESRKVSHCRPIHSLSWTQAGADTATPRRMTASSRRVSSATLKPYQALAGGVQQFRDDYWPINNAQGGVDNAERPQSVQIVLGLRTGEYNVGDVLRNWQSTRSRLCSAAHGDLQAPRAEDLLHHQRQ